MKNKKVWNVLVFPGGTENGLEINKSLRYAKEVKLFSVSSGVKNHAEFMYKNHFTIADIFSNECLSELNSIIDKSNIDYIYPANSLVIDFLINNREKLKCKIIQPESEIVKLIRSKKKTYSLFEGTIKIPFIYNSLAMIKNFPVFIKPDSMYGSQGVKKVETMDEIKSLNLNLEDYVISEYLPGDEFTIECFSSTGKGLMYSMARSRERIRMGTSMRSERANQDIQIETQKMANSILSKLNIEGLWFFQVKYNVNHDLCLLEIESRVAGTMAFSRCYGVNLPLANLYLMNDIELILNKQKYDLIIDRSLANRYKTSISFETVYIDLDDTIIVKGKINIEIMKFLYQCINKKIRIILISKSLEEDKEKYLRKYKLIQLFDEIIWLKETANKADHIKYMNSIFIDDSFSQRLEVEKRLSIPTFEPSMIEVLINDKGE